MQTLVNYAILSNTQQLVTPEDKKAVSALYATTNWQQSQLSAPLEDVLANPALIVIKTDNITVIDFDDDKVFQQALAFNSSLSAQQQAQLIIKSTRRGGHFYYLPNPDVEVPLNHTKQKVIDILTTIKHNVIAPTVADKGKVILYKGQALTPYNGAINTFIALHVLQNLPQATRAMAIHQGERRSDDAKDFIKAYLANIVSQRSFDQFYNVPDPIPEGMSNQVYLTLSTRLGSDETISTEDYLETMTKFNLHHQRKTREELQDTITRRMVSNQNNLWRYDANKETNTFTTQHRRFKTQISAYFNTFDGSYLVHYLDDEGSSRVHTTKTSAAYAELLEKISNMSRSNIRNATNRVAPVEVIKDYTKPSGYRHETATYNSAFINSNLAAFSGARPLAYKEPTALIEMLKYMWGENYEYLMASTKYRYSTFKYSPVVTFLQGTEGSGKDLTIMLLSAGFAQRAQTLNYQLMKDKHSNWQTEENAIFSEVGDWKNYEREDLLAELKTISGSNGMVTFRDMQKTSIVVPTLIKIWITGNNWFKVHSDPLTQRRVHVVYMGSPLAKELGGPYSQADMDALLSEESIQNFYHYLGTQYEPTVEFTVDKYMTATSMQHTESYQMYIEDVESNSDKVATLLWTRSYPKLEKSLKLYNLQLSDLTYKYTKDGNLAVAVNSLKTAFARASGGDVIAKTINRLAVEKEGNRRLQFAPNPNVEKCITFFDAPENLESVTPLEGIEAD